MQRYSWQVIYLATYTHSEIWHHFIYTSHKTHCTHAPHMMWQFKQKSKYLWWLFKDKDSQDSRFVSFSLLYVSLSCWPQVHSNVCTNNTISPDILRQTARVSHIPELSATTRYRARNLVRLISTHHIALK